MTDSTQHLREDAALDRVLAAAPTLSADRLAALSARIIAEAPRQPRLLAEPARRNSGPAVPTRSTPEPRTRLMAAAAAMAAALVVGIGLGVTAADRFPGGTAVALVAETETHDGWALALTALGYDEAQVWDEDSLL